MDAYGVVAAIPLFGEGIQDPLVRQWKELDDAIWKRVLTRIRTAKDKEESDAISRKYIQACRSQLDLLRSLTEYIVTETTETHP